MAASSSCSSVGAAIDKLGRASNGGAEGSLHVGPQPTVDCRKAMKGADDHGGQLVISISPIMPNNNLQASRIASIAVAATAWAGLSMFPVAGLAMAYDGDHHRNAGGLAFNTYTSMLQPSDHVILPRHSETADQLHEQDGVRTFNAEMKASVGNVPSIKPPNEGLNSPWVPKINGLTKKDNNKRASMRCPKWTESELEMVLPDFQGWPKPFPRKQGRLYPFWPATASTNSQRGDSNFKNLIQGHSDQSRDESSSLVIKSAVSAPDGGAHDPDDRKTSPSSSAPPPQNLQRSNREAGCFTM